MKLKFLLAISLALASAAAVHSADMPKRKSGLWEITVLSARGKAPRNLEQCVDEKTDELMQTDMQGMARPECSKRDIRRDGNTVTVDSICKMGNTTSTTHAVFTGKYDSAYHVDIKMSYDPPMHGIKESATSIDAKWLGPCKAGQKPGDISMPGMPNINMNEMMKNMPKAR